MSLSTTTGLSLNMGAPKVTSTGKQQPPKKPKR